MRIIGGRYGSRIIAIPKGVHVRATQDKVREAIFNILGDIGGRSVLDLFAGSGAMGIEALSRGASRSTFVDISSRCTETILSNLLRLGITLDSFEIVRSDALKFLDGVALRGTKFDIVMIDPPYQDPAAINCLINADNHDILSPYGILVAEHHKKDSLAADLRNLVLLKERRYGDTVVSIYRNAR